MVTSRAVVGSSAMTRSGSHMSAIAIITRCRSPPESLVRILPQAPLGPGHAHFLEQPHRAVPGLRRARSPVAPLGFDELVAHGVGRVQGGHRLLEDHAHPVPPEVRHLRVRRARGDPRRRGRAGPPCAVPAAAAGSLARGRSATCRNPIPPRSRGCVPVRPGSRPPGRDGASRRAPGCRR